MYTILLLFVALPYFFLFHIGFISFLIFLISSLAKRRFGIRLTRVKLIACLYGIAGGLLLPFMEAYFSYHGLDAPMGPIFFNIPALLSLIFLPSTDRDIAEYHWQIFLIYSSYGLLGGWGLGQLIDWLRARRKK